MTIIIFILLYLLGCILSAGRIVGSMYGIEMNYPTRQDKELSFLEVLKMNDIGFILTLSSWLGFIAGIMVYLKEEIYENHHYLLKYSFK